MHGVQAQAVQVELVEPVERVVHDEGPRDLAARRVEVEGVAPRSLAVAAEERRGVAGKIVALRPEVVVDHVEKDGEPSGVTGFDERLEILRLSICGVRGERQHSVIPPAPAAREIRHGHELHRGDAEGDQMVEPVRHSREGAFPGEGSHVELVEDETFGGDAVPLRIGPGVIVRIDHLARPVDVERLIARRGVGHEELAVDAERVSRAGGGIPRHPLRPARGVSGHGEALLPVGEPELDTLGGGGPQPEARGAVVARLRAERHAVASPYRGLPGHDLTVGRRRRRTTSERPSSG
jgi:hypothetical protein